MTDNQSDVSKPNADQKLPETQSAKNDNPQASKTGVDESKVEKSESVQNKPMISQTSQPASAPVTAPKSAPATKEPQIKKVDIAIAGGKYPIYCPVHEEEELRSAVAYINNYALELRSEAPNLSQENLLVLCCLNLYEKINGSNKANDERRDEDKKAEGLLNKIIKDAQSVL